MKGLDIKEISGDIIKTTLQQVVEDRLGSKDVKIWVEAGSKQGNVHVHIDFKNYFRRRNW